MWGEYVGELSRIDCDGDREGVIVDGARRDDGRCRRENVVFCRVIWKRTYTKRGAQEAAPKERKERRTSSAPWADHRKPRWSEFGADECWVADAVGKEMQIHDL